VSKTLDHHVVARAREIIADEKHWTQFDYAQLDTSDEADPADPGAVRFCAVGALRRAAFELSSDSDSFAVLADRVQDGIESFAKTRGHLSCWAAGRSWCPATQSHHQPAQ
jgi:hypothetical protein